MVDATVAAAKIAAIRDAIDRIRKTLPPDVGAFETDRSAREIVILNLFVALQETVALATHWLADAGLDVPDTYREIFLGLAGRGLIPPDLARRLGATAGFRNLVAHQYGVLDPRRVHQMAASELEDLVLFCGFVSRAVSG